jgi:hypothetical protein
MDRHAGGPQGLAARHSTNSMILQTMIPLQACVLFDTGWHALAYAHAAQLVQLQEWTAMITCM